MSDYDNCPEEEKKVEPIDIEDKKEYNESLNMYIRRAKKAAKDFGYPKEYIDKLDECKNKVQVDQILITCRKRFLK